MATETPREVFPKHSLHKLNKMDYVAADGRRKELIWLENKARKSWQERWKFLEKDSIEKLHQAEAVKLGLPKDFMQTRYRGERERQEIVYLQNLKRKPVPQLMSAMVGWRSSDPDCWFDPPGPMYVSDKTYPLTTEQTLHEHWNCIRLG